MSPTSWNKPSWRRHRPYCGPLAHTATSPLPVRMRNELARMVRRLGALSRELRRVPDAVMQERAAEAQRPPA